MLVPSAGTRKLLEARLQAYPQQLAQSPEGLTFLDDRGFTNEIIEAFQLGFVDDPLKGDGRFRDRLAIPYLTPSGVVGFKFRSIDGSPDRYSKDKGEPNRLFNTRVLKGSREVVITEGEFDCMAASQAGLQAIGIPGASNWKSEWSRVFYNREVTVLADGDDAGHEFAEVVATKLHGVRIVDCPSGEDVNSLLFAKGEDFVREMVLG